MSRLQQDEITALRLDIVQQHQNFRVRSTVHARFVHQQKSRIASRHSPSSGSSGPMIDTPATTK
jgi:hypothetical protein